MLLSKYYSVQICVIYIQIQQHKLYGEEFSEWIYLLYDGIHYDAISRNACDEFPRETDITWFDTSDDIALNGALFLG